MLPRFNRSRQPDERSIAEELCRLNEAVSHFPMQYEYMRDAGYPRLNRSIHAIVHIWREHRAQRLGLELLNLQKEDGSRQVTPLDFEQQAMVGAYAEALVAEDVPIEEIFRVSDGFGYEGFPPDEQTE
jgi:hypothetical protein